MRPPLGQDPPCMLSPSGAAWLRHADRHASDTDIERSALTFSHAVKQPLARSLTGRYSNPRLRREIAALHEATRSS
jgi:hypothetical protein